MSDGEVSDNAEVGSAGKRAASLAILRAIIDGRCVLPDSAPGLEVLTPEERSALGLSEADRHTTPPVEGMR